MQTSRNSTSASLNISLWIKSIVWPPVVMHAWLIWSVCCFAVIHKDESDTGVQLCAAESLRSLYQDKMMCLLSRHNLPNAALPRSQFGENSWVKTANYLPAIP